MFRLDKYPLKFTIKTRDRWRHQKRLWRHHFDLSNFWFETETLTIISNLSHQYVIFSKPLAMTSSSAMTSSTSKNFFKTCSWKPILFKTWHFYNFWIGCWTVKTLWHKMADFKGRKGGSPISKTWGFFWWLTTWSWIIVQSLAYYKFFPG